MMSEKKARIEPEVSFPDSNGGAQGTAGERSVVEELVPGPGEEVGPQEAPSDADRIAGLEAELSEMRDRWMRTMAESENVRRRAERDRKDAESYGGTKLARDVLAVWDNLERALKAADDELKANHQAFFEGVELTQRELLNAFGKHRIVKVTPERGERFDPNRHQAMFEAPVPGAEPGTVIEVLQDGFTIADRLLRPALVGVARAAPEAETGAETGAEAAPGGQEQQEGADGGRPG